MSPSVLTLNAGSSNLKFALFGMAGSAVMRGKIEHMDTAPYLLARDVAGAVLLERRWPAECANLSNEVVGTLLHLADTQGGPARLEGSGHRVVHGGAGYSADRLYEDHASSKRDDRPGLEACLKAVRDGDTLVAWKLDRLGRDLRHLFNLVHDLTKRGVGLRVLAGEGAAIDTTTANGRLMFSFFAALAEFKRELVVERTKAGLASARARGRNDGRLFKISPTKLRLDQAAKGQPETKVRALCAELGTTRQTLYRHVDPAGRLRLDGERLLGHHGRAPINSAEGSGTAQGHGLTP